MVKAIQRVLGRDSGYWPPMKVKASCDRAPSPQRVPHAAAGSACAEAAEDSPTGHLGE